MLFDMMAAKPKEFRMFHDPLRSLKIIRIYDDSESKNTRILDDPDLKVSINVRRCFIDGKFMETNGILLNKLMNIDEHQ